MFDGPTLGAALLEYPTNATVHTGCCHGFRQGWLCATATMLAAAACGSAEPFPMAPVGGKVTYEDGSPIPGDRIVVKFNPLEIKKSGKASASAGHAEVNPADGTFSGATTWKHMDGVVVGRHKVVVMAFHRLPNGIDEPTSAVPGAYHSPSTTPLEVDVPSGGNRNLEIKVQRPMSQGRRR